MNISHGINDLRNNLRLAGYSDYAINGAVDELSKALETTSSDLATAYTGGRALQHEYLDSTMKSNLYASEEFTFTKKLYQSGLKLNLKTTEYKSLRKNSYGGLGGVTDENDISDVTNSDFERLSTLCKTWSTKRGVTLHSKMAENVVDPEAQEQLDGSYVVNARREITFWYGDKSVVSAECDGLASFISLDNTPNNVIDIRGEKISSTNGWEALTKTAPSRVRKIKTPEGDLYTSRATDIWCDTIVLSDIQDQLKEVERYIAGSIQTNATVNPIIYRNVNSPFGVMNINENIFMDFYEEVGAEIGGPGAPTGIVVTTPADGTGRTQFAAGDAGSYYYKIQSINKKGRGGIVASASTAVAAADKVSIVIDNVNDAEGYHIYRSKKDASDASDCRLIARIGKSSGTTTTFTDWNDKLPGTKRVYVLSMSPTRKAIQYASFIELLKFMLYSTNEAAYPFLMLASGALVVDLPQAHAVIENVSPSDLGWY